MNEPTTEYQKAITAAIAAAGHAVEWKPIAVGHTRNVLHIDGIPCGSDLIGEKPHARSVDHALTYKSIWRARALAADPKKAAATLLERLAAVKVEATRQAKHSAARTANAAAASLLREAFGPLPGLQIEVRGSLATVSFAAPVSPEQAARLGDAIRAVLGAP